MHRAFRNTPGRPKFFAPQEVPLRDAPSRGLAQSGRLRGTLKARTLFINNDF
jgi:hypothetical protein